MSDCASIQRGDTAPDFCLPNKDKVTKCLESYRGKWLILYFYPKDNTQGCTLEAIDFSHALKEFETMNAVIVGVSADSAESHCRFTEKHGLTIELLTDAEHTVMERYGVWQMKKMYGKESMGVVRSTFLINPDGVIAHIWSKVKVPGHIEQVKEELKKLI